MALIFELLDWILSGIYLFYFSTPLNRSFIHLRALMVHPFKTVATGHIVCVCAHVWDTVRVALVLTLLRRRF